MLTLNIAAAIASIPTPRRSSNSIAGMAQATTDTIDDKTLDPAANVEAAPLETNPSHAATDSLGETTESHGNTGSLSH